MNIEAEKGLITRRKLNTMAVLSALMPVTSMAQSEYPSRPVKVISPFPAGAFTDGIARAYIKELQDDLASHLFWTINLVRVPILPHLLCPLHLRMGTLC